ncbi:hypothetical protein R2K11_10995 [Pseudomonas aeruginosa]|uniref:hypothetical protein n=1 Tax=Pseudomonas aeruginosa TaxID=287 RepID=UPI00129879A9|nr:hypothetical protein [Pseudomonas aeruginosa]MBG7337101.1 hypothetical protein [Pseudomonas aeruginosa]MBH9069455.1 hypothetical protein [Pseudomonas aeruginosa]HCE6118884.1 hypothetical protein [Pseudomonas aeruginosa]HEJ2242728.1 hypothetical protein [Pseudomonas aeruginosa]
MALKSKEWFFKKCLAEIKDYGRFSHLAWSVLQKGIGQSDGTRGHVMQAVGVSQEFLTSFPAYSAVIKASDPTLPFDVAAHRQLQNDLKNWLAGQNGTFGRAAYGYSYDSFKRNTTATLGGTRRGGGGADDEFKRVLRLMAEYL